MVGAEVLDCGVAIVSATPEGELVNPVSRRACERDQMVEFERLGRLASTTTGTEERAPAAVPQGDRTLDRGWDVTRACRFRASSLPRTIHVRELHAAELPKQRVQSAVEDRGEIRFGDTMPK